MIILAILLMNIIYNKIYYIILKMKTKKNIRNNKCKKKKSMKGGAGSMMQQTLKTAFGDDTCNLSLDYLIEQEKYSYNPNKMLKKAIKSDFLIKENPAFKKLFIINLRTFCGSSRENKYLKFCSNLFSCIKEPILLYEVLNDIFDLDIDKQPELKTLFKNTGLTLEDFYENEKKSRTETMAMFLVKVLFKTINKYELKHPPKNKSPTNNIYLKEKILLVLKNVGLDVDIKTETVEKLKEKILSKELAINDYYSSRLFSDDYEQGVKKLKEEKSDSYILIVIGLLLGTIVLRSNLFDSPPGIGGSIS